MNRTIVVVDDNADIRDLSATVLNAAGYHVREAENGEHALEILDQLDHRPSLVLLDMMMPVMDGASFLQHLRARDPTCTLPVVVVTASGEESVPGATRVVAKPTSPEALLRLVHELCGPPAG